MKPEILSSQEHDGIINIVNEDGDISYCLPDDIPRGAIYPVEDKKRPTSSGKPRGQAAGSRPRNEDARASASSASGEASSATDIKRRDYLAKLAAACGDLNMHEGALESWEGGHKHGDYASKEQILDLRDRSLSRVESSLARACLGCPFAEGCSDGDKRGLVSFLGITGDVGKRNRAAFKRALAPKKPAASCPDVMIGIKSRRRK